MITDTSEYQTTARDAFDVRRSPLCKMALFFRTDEEAVDFADKYNKLTGMVDLDAEELGKVQVAEPHLDSMLSYVIVPNIPACNIDETLKGIETYAPATNLPHHTHVIVAANKDPISFEDVIGDFDGTDIDVIPQKISILDDDLNGLCVIPSPGD